METKEKKKNTKHPIRNAWVISITSSIISAGILYLVAFLFDIRPKIGEILTEQIEIRKTCKELLEKLPPLPPVDLKPCNVGINEKIHKDYAWIYKGSPIEVENGSTILLTNMGSTIKPSVQLTVKVLEGEPNSETLGGFFVSSETLRRLDIDEEDIWNGIFPMMYKILR